jgi:hypothetical protein
MSYLINKSDGTILATVADGQVDSLSTDLTLIGKNYSGFGESLNENFVKLLENFAGISRPTRPVRGQIWFDLTELKLKVYNGTAFQPVSSATISNTQPTTLTPGDLWFSDVDKQLYFYDGTTTYLLGPTYAASQGLSGLRVQTILDTLNQSRVITVLYNNGTVVGIWSTSETEFTPKIPITGYTGIIVPGFNPGAISGFKLNATAADSDALGGQSASSYVLNTEDGEITGRLNITNGIEIGTAKEIQLFSVNGDLILNNTGSQRFIRIGVTRSSTLEEALVIGPTEASDQTVRIYENNLNSLTVVGGSMRVDGNLTVQGTTTTINTTNLTISDKNVVLADGATNNNDADGGGITLNAGNDLDKTIIYTVASDAWNSSENFNVADDKYFGIGGTALIEKRGDRYYLTEAVTRAPGIEIFGTQAEWTIDSLYLNTNKISVQDSAVLSGSNLDLELEPKGTGNVVLVGSPKITGLADPVSLQDATTKNYVDSQLKARSLAFSFDISDGITNAGIATWLEVIAPVAEYDNGTIARILCSATTNLTSDVDINSSLNQSTFTVSTPTGTGTALSNITVSTITLPAPATTVSRLVKTYQIIGGAWTFVS